MDDEFPCMKQENVIDLLIYTSGFRNKYLIFSGGNTQYWMYFNVLRFCKTYLFRLASSIVIKVITSILLYLVYSWLVLFEIKTLS